MKGTFEQKSFSTQLFLLVLIFFCCNLLASFGTAFFAQFTDITEAANKLRITLFIQNSIIFIGTPLIAQYVLQKEPAKTVFQLNRPAFLPIVLGCMAILFSGPVIDMLNTWNQGLHLPPGMESLEEWMISSEKQAEVLNKQLLEIDSWGELIANLIVIALLAGIGEELFFRGLLQPFFIKWTENTHIGVFIAAFLFSAIHLQFFGFIPRLVSGILLGYLYIASRNLWVPIAAHAINNLWVIFFTPNTLNREYKLITDMNNVENNWWIVTGSIILTAVCLFPIWKNYRSSSSN